MNKAGAKVIDIERSAPLDSETSSPVNSSATVGWMPTCAARWRCINTTSGSIKCMHTRPSKSALVTPALRASAKPAHTAMQHTRRNTQMGARQMPETTAQGSAAAAGRHTGTTCITRTLRDFAGVGADVVQADDHVLLAAVRLQSYLHAIHIGHSKRTHTAPSTASMRRYREQHAH